MRIILPKNANGAQLAVFSGITSLVLALLLQFVNPYFFLTDDNLTCAFPVLREVGDALLKGELIRGSRFLFQGNNIFIRNPGGAAVYHPLSLAAALIASLTGKPVAIEVIGTFHLVLAAVGFAVLGYVLCRRFALNLDCRILFFISQSYAFGFAALCIATSWIGFIVPHAIMPYILLGMMDPKKKRGVFTIVLAVVYMLTAGHLHPGIYALITIGLLGLGLWATEKNPEYLYRFFVGSSIGLALLLPVFLAQTDSFLSMPRSSGLSFQESMAVSYSSVNVICGTVLGPICEMVLSDPLQQIPSLGSSFQHALPFMIAGPTLLFALLFGFRRQPIVEMILLVSLLLVVVIDRPPFVARLFSLFPVLKSLRWPFRELIQLNFTFHLLLVFLLPNLKKSIMRITILAGTALAIGTFLFCPPPSLNMLPLDRKLVISGTADRVWQRIREIAPSDSLLVPIIARQTFIDYRPWIPNSLLGTHNFPAAMGVKYASGYIIPGFAVSSDPRFEHPYYAGFFPPQVYDEVKNDADIGRFTFLSLSESPPWVITMKNSGRVIGQIDVDTQGDVLVTD